jgi:hypothetical protein
MVSLLEDLKLNLYVNFISPWLCHPNTYSVMEVSFPLSEGKEAYGIVQ